MIGMSRILTTHKYNTLNYNVLLAFIINSVTYRNRQQTMLGDRHRLYEGQYLVKNDCLYDSELKPTCEFVLPL